MKTLGCSPVVLGALVLVVLGLAATLGSTLRVTKIPALEPGANVWPDDSFRESAYFASPAEIPRGLETRGSRVDGRVEFRGEFHSGWFVARPSVTLVVAGFPRLPGNSLQLEIRDAVGGITSIAFDHPNPRDSWRPWTIALPASAAAFRISAVDGETGTEGWLAVSEPFETRFHPALLPQTERTFLAFVIQVLFFIAIGVSVSTWFRVPEKLKHEPALVPLVAAAVVAALGYLAFWIYFAHPVAGRIFSWAVCGVSGATLLIRGRAIAGNRTSFSPVLLAVAIGLFYLALLLLFEPTRFSFAATSRFSEGLPSDNEIPRAFAERLWNGESPRHLWGDWLSSDRPPLQSGWLLLTWPVLQGLGFDVDTFAATGGMCFQLLWVLAVWALAQRLGVTARQALAVTAALAFSGVFLLFSVYVSPKLAAAALVVAAYLLCFSPGVALTRGRFACGGGCAALGWLAHGGVAFSLLALVPVAAIWSRSVTWTQWRFAAIVFAVIAAPWTIYQRTYEPPGNRLLKWHLAGVTEVDPRGTLETLRDSYRTAGLVGTLAAKGSNVRMQFGGDWARLPHENNTAELRDLRYSDTTFTVRAWGAWLFAGIAPIVWWTQRRRAPETKMDDIRPRVNADQEPEEMLLNRKIGEDGKIERLAFPLFPTFLFTCSTIAWGALGIAVWLVLMFLPNSASIHQGTLVTQLLSFSLLAVAALRLHRWFFVFIATVQAWWFVALWVPASGAVEGKLQAFPALLALLSGLSLLGIVWSMAGGKLSRGGAEIEGFSSAPSAPPREIS